MYREFLLNAAANALASNNPVVYENAFKSTVGSFGGDENAVRRLWVPRPAALVKFMAAPIVPPPPIENIVDGLFIGEYIQDNPTGPRITWEYFAPGVRPVAERFVMGK